MKVEEATEFEAHNEIAHDIPYVFARGVDADDKNKPTKILLMAHAPVEFITDVIEQLLLIYPDALKLLVDAALVRVIEAASSKGKTLQ